MVNISYITGPVNSGKTRFVIEKAVETIKFGNTVFFLLPSVNHIDYMKHTILKFVEKTYPGQIFFGTFIAWANRVLDAAQKNIQLITSGEEWFNIFLLQQRSNIAAVNRPGVVSILRELFVDFRDSGWVNADLRELFLKANLFRQAEWFKIYESLRNQNSKYCIGTTSELTLEALELLQNNSGLLRGNLLIVDGFYEFTPVQKKILKILTQHFDEVIVSLTNDKEHYVYNCIQDLTGFVGEGEITQKERQSAKKVCFEKIQSNLFNIPLVDTLWKDIYKPAEWKNQWDKFSVKVLKCPTRRREIETAARVIKRWVLDGLGLKNIGVLYRGSYDYGKLISLIFPQFGIPVSDSDKKIVNSEPAQLLFRIFAVNSKNFARQNVLDLIRHKAIRCYYGDDVLQDFEYISSEWGIPFGRQAWLEQFEHKMNFLQWIKSSNLKDFELYPEIIDQQINKMKKISPILWRLFDDISLPSNAKWSEYESLVIEIYNRYFNSIQELSFREAILKIRRICKKMSKLAGSNEDISLSRYSLALNRFLGSEVLGTSRNVQSKAVYVSNVMDARGKIFDGVILLGMVDSEFPAIRMENPLLNNELRRELNEAAGEGILSETGTNLDEEKLLFYLALSRVKERLLITFPELSINGQQYPVSPFVEEVFKCFEMSNGLDCENREISYEVIPASNVIPEIDEIASEGDIKQLPFASNWTDNDKNFFRAIIKSGVYNEIEKAVDIEKSRFENIPCRWNGVLCEKSPFPDFLKRPFSVTRIQDYAWCPFLFLCRHILKIFTPEEPTMDLAPIADGLLIHKVLENFVARFVKTGKMDWKDYLETEIEEKINTNISEINRSYRPQFKFLPNGIWSKRIEDIKNGLEAFVDIERKFSDKGFHPAYLEANFLIKNSVFTVKIGDKQEPVEIRGKIDRIDLDASGQEVIIIEYKRSSASVQDPQKGVADSIYFQLPLYLIAAKNFLKNKKICGAFSYVFREGKRRKGVLTKQILGRNSLITNEEMEDLLEMTIVKVQEKLNGIADGNFFVKPFDFKRCVPNSCEFFDLCRIDPKSFRF